MVRLTAPCLGSETPSPYAHNHCPATYSYTTLPHPLSALCHVVSTLQGAAQPVFPCEDEWEHVAWDEYGASLDYADFEPGETTGAAALLPWLLRGVISLCCCVP